MQRKPNMVFGYEPKNWGAHGIDRRFMLTLL